MLAVALGLHLVRESLRRALVAFDRLGWLRGFRLWVFLAVDFLHDALNLFFDLLDRVLFLGREHVFTLDNLFCHLVGCLEHGPFCVSHGSTALRLLLDQLVNLGLLLRVFLLVSNYFLLLGFLANRFDLLVGDLLPLFQVDFLADFQVALRALQQVAEGLIRERRLEQVVDVILAHLAVSELRDGAHYDLAHLLWHLFVHGFRDLLVHFGGLHLFFLNGALLINQTFPFESLLHDDHALLQALYHRTHLLGLVLLASLVILDELAFDGGDGVPDLFSMLLVFLLLLLLPSPVFLAFLRLHLPLVF